MKIRVKCPYCGGERSTRSVRRVICFRCGKSFKVFCKKRGKGYSASRIVKIEKGSLQELHKAFYEMKRRESKKQKI